MYMQVISQAKDIGGELFTEHFYWQYQYNILHKPTVQHFSGHLQIYVQNKGLMII